MKFEKFFQAVEKNTKKAIIGTAILVAGSGQAATNEKNNDLEKDNFKIEFSKDDVQKDNSEKLSKTINYEEASLEINNGKELSSEELDPTEFLRNISKHKNDKNINLVQEITKAAALKPDEFLFAIRNLKDVPGLNLTEEIVKAADREPNVFLILCSDFKDVPGLDLVKGIYKAAKSKPDQFLIIAKNLKTFKDFNLAKEISAAAEKAPHEFLDNIADFKDIEDLDLAAETVKAGAKNPETILYKAQSLTDVKNLNLAEEISKASEKKPEIFFLQFKNFKNLPNFNLGEELNKLVSKNSYMFLKNVNLFTDIENFNLAQKISEAAHDNPRLFLSNISDFKNIAGLDLVAEITKLIENEPALLFLEILPLREFGYFKVKSDIVVKAAQNDPKGFIRNIQNLKDVEGLDLNHELLEAADKEPEVFMANVADFKNISTLNLAEVIQKSANKNPWAFLYRAKDFNNIPNLDLAKEIPKFAEKDPAAFLASASDYEKITNLDLVSEITKAAHKTPSAFLLSVTNLKRVEGINFTNEITLAAQIEPRMFLYHALKYKGIVEEHKLSDLIEQVLQIYPEGVSEEDEKVENGRSLLDEIKNPKLKSTEILKSIENKNSVILLQDMVINGLSENEALKIVNNQEDLLKSLVKIKSTPNHLGAISVENNLKNLSLKMVENVNSLHESDNETRFKSVKKLNPSGLYSLMVYGEEEIFTSSFNGLFNILKDKMTKDKLDGKTLIDQVGKNKFRTFVKECIGFNRFDEFLSLMDKDDANNLIIDVVKNLETSNDKLAQATTLADIFGSVKDKNILNILQNQVKSDYERVINKPNFNKNDEALYGYLASILANKVVSNKEWYKETANKFPIENVTELKSSDLFNKKNVNVQEYFFYKDEDGQNSFKSFMSQYENDKNWKIEKKEKYVIVSAEKNGKKIEIFANYPNSEEEGTDAIKQALGENKEVVTTVVHRGHSYHAQSTIEKISNNAKFVSLGSCGGYNNIYNVLEKSSDAHILSTKGTGTMLINDPVLKELNLDILSGKNIVWSEFWSKIEKSPLSGNLNFKDYVAPHKNMGAMFIKAYNKKIQEK